VVGNHKPVVDRTVPGGSVAADAVRQAAGKVRAGALPRAGEGVDLLAGTEHVEAKVPEERDVQMERGLP
jgi:hypothetical protein